MRSSKEHAPYSLYRKLAKSGLFWYVRFWDAKAKEYNVVRSTGIQVEGKRERWREADDAAKAILKELRRDPAKTRPSNNAASPPIPASADNPLQPQCVKDTPLTQYF